MQALAIYKQLLAEEDPDPVYYTYAAACLYYMGLYGEAESMALQVTCFLKNLLLWSLSWGCPDVALQEGCFCTLCRLLAIGLELHRGQGIAAGMPLVSPGMASAEAFRQLCPAPCAA